MLFGIFVGLLLNNLFLNENILLNINIVFNTISSIFLILLKMIVLPLIFVSVLAGIVSISDISMLGRIGIKTLSLYILTTIIAISLALLVSSFINYDTSNISLVNNINIDNIENTQGSVLSVFIPENFFQALSEGNVIQVLFFAIFLGIASSLIKNDIPQFINLIENLNKIFNKMVLIIIKLTPIAVFCLLAETFSIQGIGVFMPILKYFLVVILVLLIHFFATYSFLLTIFSNLNNKTFYTKLKSLIIFTFSTSSSNASIPFTLKTVNNDFGVDKSVSSFSIPLGATINMDGTAIMQGCATFFLASYYGINLEFGDFITIILTATMASIGTAGVPGAGIIMLSLILAEVGIPLEGIGLLLGVDRLLDMLRTSVNVCGDTCITCIVANNEKLIDLKKYNNCDY
jgi:Na+/H+-dicarboxylate symporter|tara:strand:- start:4749 stop:5957 length:1209 start_codon:yes stop_codon:yes gene_type:complete